MIDFAGPWFSNIQPSVTCAEGWWMSEAENKLKYHPGIAANLPHKVASLPFLPVAPSPSLSLAQSLPRPISPSPSLSLAQSLPRPVAPSSGLPSTLNTCQLTSSVPHSSIHPSLYFRVSYPLDHQYSVLAEVVSSRTSRRRDQALFADQICGCRPVMLYMV